jgi:hypothetical protein
LDVALLDASEQEVIDDLPGDRDVWNREVPASPRGVFPFPGRINAYSMQ